MKEASKDLREHAGDTQVQVEEYPFGRGVHAKIRFVNSTRSNFLKKSWWVSVNFWIKWIRVRCKNIIYDLSNASLVDSKRFGPSKIVNFQRRRDRNSPRNPNQWNRTNTTLRSSGHVTSSRCLASQRTTLETLPWQNLLDLSPSLRAS